jgi:predicted RNase H-like nuclease (RuvC/YqgF family)
MDTLKGLTETNNVFQRQLEAKDKELETVKSELTALGKLVKEIANTDYYKEMANGLEKLAEKLAQNPEFMEKFRKEADKLKSGHFKTKP